MINVDDFTEENKIINISNWPSKNPCLSIQNNNKWWSCTNILMNAIQERDKK